MARIPSQDWEQVFQDFRGPAESRNKWLSQFTPQGMLEQAVQACGRKDFPLKLQMLSFIEENAALLLEDSVGFDLLVETLRSTLLSSTSPESNNSSASFKEQMMVTVSSTMVTLQALTSSPRSLEALVELLLSFINRPNHSVERQLRATACECLRELEKEYPLLLHSTSGHLYALCLGERTHAVQSYTLLLTTVLCNVAKFMQQLRSYYAGTYSILLTPLPLVPYSIPGFLTNGFVPSETVSSAKDFSHECVKEFRRVVSFLLEKPNNLTEHGLSEFISDLCHVVGCLELQPGNLKIPFGSLLHAYSPVSCHAFLTIFTRFPDAFERLEVEEISRRLVLFSREYAQPLTIRLLALHWLLGVENIVVARGKAPLLPVVARSLYVEVFDSLALKAAKLECLAKCAAIFDKQGSSENGVHVIQEDHADMASKLLVDGLVSLSSYKWLPCDSIETRLLFHTLHRFLVSELPHSPRMTLDQTFFHSSLFRTLEDRLVDTARNVRKLVDRILSLVDRFLSCDGHQELGERLLRTFSEELIPSLPVNLNFPAYFPLLERIAESSKIPPGELLLALSAYIKHRVAKDSGKNAACLWLRGSEVLNICRSLLIHHQSSRVFRKMTDLLGYLCVSFPDIEVRDNARFYLRMLLSVPGNRLREILTYGDEKTEDAKPQLLDVPSFLGSQSPRAYQGKKHLPVSSFIHLNRETPLLVRSSWSLVLHDSFKPIVETFTEDRKPPYQVVDVAVPDDDGECCALLTDEQVPRMMDARTAETLGILRRHFSQVPETGLKIEVTCRLRLRLPCDGPGTYGIYAVVLSFSTSGLYGPIPPVRVPFLLSEPATKSPKSIQTADEGERSVRFLTDTEKQEQDIEEGDRLSEVVKVVLEPKQPVPTLVDSQILFTDEDAQTIQGQLESIPVGIEDLFMKPPVPEDVSNKQEYLLSLFNALWFGCSGPGKLGTEIFLLKGGRQGLGIQGSESVKLLESQADRVVLAVERCLAPFVVSVSGDALKQMTRDSQKFGDTLWTEEEIESGHEVLRIEHSPRESLESDEDGGRLGCFLILVFLPPRYHLLMRMEVSEWSTLIRIRTDYWPSLAHVDEFLESLTSPGASL